VFLSVWVGDGCGFLAVARFEGVDDAAADDGDFAGVTISLSECGAPADFEGDFVILVIDDDTFTSSSSSSSSSSMLLKTFSWEDLQV
jgi:hypothetical protein